MPAKSITAVAISDLHGHLIDVPPCDYLFISGDFSCHGESDVQYKWMDGPFRQWLKEVPAKHIIACAGNHDWVCFEGADIIELMKLPWHYLQDSGIELDGLKIWGTPWVLECGWAFGLTEAELSRVFAKIPKDTDILLCHSPPMYFGDFFDQKHLGSQSLLERIVAVKPKLLVSGHIHPGYGVYSHDGIMIANAALLNNENQLSNDPLIFDLTIHEAKLSVNSRTRLLFN